MRQERFSELAYVCSKCFTVFTIGRDIARIVLGSRLLVTNYYYQYHDSCSVIFRPILSAELVTKSVLSLGLSLGMDLEQVTQWLQLLLCY